MTKKLIEVGNVTRFRTEAILLAAHALTMHDGREGREAKPEYGVGLFASDEKPIFTTDVRLAGLASEREWNWKSDPNDEPQFANLNGPYEVQLISKTGEVFRNIVNFMPEVMGKTAGATASI